jgi:hypothetical protein
MGWYFWKYSSITRRPWANAIDVLLIKRLRAKHVRSRVYQPSDVEADYVAENVEEERCHESFSKDLPNDDRGNDCTDNPHEFHVVSMLEHDIRVWLQVAHVNFDTKLLDISVLFAQKPSHVGEEEASSRVVWIGICITKFVVDAKKRRFTMNSTWLSKLSSLPMITRPLQHAVLESNRLEVDEQDLQSSIGFVGFVSEVAVSTSSDSKTSAETVAQD